MQKGESNYERIVLTVMALIAIGGSGWLIWQSMGFADTLKIQKAVQKQDFGPIAEAVDNVNAAIKRLTAPYKPWTSPVRNNKAVPLNKSVLLVMKDEQIYDLFVEDPQLRPPMTNEYLRKYDLKYLSPNVGDLDPDKDGFSNLEEFQKGTNPKDPQSHPPVTDKLFLVQRIPHDFLIVLKGSSAPFQVKITPPDGKPKGWFAEEGKAFGVGERFVVKKFEKKVVPDSRTGEKDVSELTVEDRVRKTMLILVKDVEQNLAEYDAKFEFRLGGTVEPITAKRGENFRISAAAETTYKVIDIQEDSAVISALKPDGTPDKEIVIKKG